MYAAQEGVKSSDELPIVILRAKKARGDQAMYSLFLVLGVALVILSPLALEFYLTALEHRRQRLHEKRFGSLTKTKAPAIPFTPARARW